MGQHICIHGHFYHDIDLACQMCAGVHLWLNTPEKRLEASGTSGMKAALNGVPSLSILDGWWIEGHIEGVTGFWPKQMKIAPASISKPEL